MFRQGRVETEEERIARIKRQNEEIKIREQKILEDKKFAAAQGADFKAKVSNWPSNPGSYSTPPRNQEAEHTPPSRRVRTPRQSNGGRDRPPPDPRSFLADEERDYEYEESVVPNQFNSNEKPGNDFGGRKNDRRRGGGGGGGMNRRIEGGGREERTEGSSNDLRNRLRLQQKKEWDQEKIEQPVDVVSPAPLHSEPPRRRGARGASTALGRGGNIIRRVIVNDNITQQQEPSTPKMSEVDEILERITEVHLDPSNSSNCDDTLMRPYPPALMDVTVPPPTQTQYATYPKETQPSSQHVEPNAYSAVNDYVGNQTTANQHPGSGGSYPDQNYTENDTRYGTQHAQEQNNEPSSFPYQQSSVNPGSYANQGSYNDIPNETQYASQHVQNHATPSNVYTAQLPQNQGFRANQFVNQTVQGQGTNAMAYSNQGVHSKPPGNQPLTSQAKNSVSHPNQQPAGLVGVGSDSMTLSRVGVGSDSITFTNQTHVIHSGTFTNQGLQNQPTMSTAFTNPPIQNHVNTVTYTNQFPANQGGVDYVNQPPQTQVQKLAANHPSQNHVHPYANQFQPAQVADPTAFANPPSVTQVTTAGAYMNHSPQNQVTYSNQFVPNQGTRDSGAFANQPAVTQLTQSVAHANNQGLQNQVVNAAAYANLASQIHANQVTYINQPAQNQAPHSKPNANHHQLQNQVTSSEAYANQYSLNQQLAEQEYKNKLAQSQGGVSQFVTESNYTGPQENMPRQNVFRNEPVIQEHTANQPVYQQPLVRRAITSIPMEPQTLYSEHATHPADSTDIPTIPVLPDFSVPPPSLIMPPKTISSQISTPFSHPITKAEVDQFTISQEAVAPLQQYSSSPSEGYVTVAVVNTLPQGAQYITAPSQSVPYVTPHTQATPTTACQPQSAAYMSSQRQSGHSEPPQNQSEMYGTFQAQSAAFATTRNQSAPYESCQNQPDVYRTHPVQSASYVTPQNQAASYASSKSDSAYETSQSATYISTHNESAYATSQSPLTSYETSQNQQDMYGTNSAPYATIQPSYASTESQSATYVDNTGVGYQENPNLAYEDSSSMNQYESQQQDAMYMMSMEPQYESAKTGMEHQYESGNAAGVMSNQQYERKNEFPQEHHRSQNSMYYVSEVPQSQPGPTPLSSAPPTIGNLSLQNRLQRIKQEKSSAAIPEPTPSPQEQLRPKTSDTFTSSQPVKKSGGKTKNFSFLKQAIRQNQENLKEYLSENQDVSSVETVRTLAELNTGHRVPQTEVSAGHRGQQAEVTAGHRGHQAEVTAGHRRPHDRHEVKQGFNPAQHQDRHGDSSSSLRNRNFKRRSPNNLDSTNKSNKFVTNFDAYDKLDFDSVGGRPVAHPARSRHTQNTSQFPSNASHHQGNASKSFTTIESLRGNSGRQVESYLQEKLAKAKQSQDRSGNREKQGPSVTDKSRVPDVHETDSNWASERQTSDATSASVSSPPKPTSPPKKLDWIAECENSEELREREARANGSSWTSVQHANEEKERESNSSNTLEKDGETQDLTNRDEQTTVKHGEELIKDGHEESAKKDTQQQKSHSEEGKTVECKDTEEKEEGDDEDEEWEDVSDEEDKKKTKNKKYGGRYYGRY
uniref:Uncharacterized protein n=1 Tax=Cacopsylla melanoneura TaxID=428564 RepID=A0A8D9AQF0_9HEMI